MKISGIQYLRAIAAIAVVIDHTTAMASFQKYFNVRAPYFEFWVTGALGVNLFFIISGFIIVVSSIQQQSLENRRTFSEFILARAIRILPMMWIAIASYFLLKNLGRGSVSDLNSYINASLLLPFGDYQPNIIWTLRHEAIFYFIFGAAFLLPIRVTHIFILWLIIPFAIFILHPVNMESAPITEKVVNNIFHPVNILFGAGVIIGFIHQRYQIFTNAELSHPLAKLLKSWIFLASAFLIVMYLVSAHFSHKSVTDIKIILYTLPLLALIVFIGSLKDTHTNKTMNYLGNASFAIYLFHTHFVSAMLGFMAKTTPNMPILLVIAIITIIATAVGCLIYHFIEDPMTKYLHQITKKRSD